MRIVFEGADLTGKSTVAKVVAEALHKPLRGRILRVGPDLIEMTQARDFLANTESVMDRCYWMTDLIYEPLFNGRQSVLKDQSILFRNDNNTIYVILTASDEVLTARYKLRGDDLQTLDKILQANRRYVKFAQQQGCQHMIVIDTNQQDKHTIQERVDVILQLIQEEKRYANH